MSSPSNPAGAGTDTSLVKQALAALRNLQNQLDDERRRQTEPIAILGMGCRYPGAASPEELWQLLLSGTDAISEVPESRWNTDGLYDGDTSRPAKLPTRRGGFLPDLDRMDAAFFGISPREAPHVDPRQRILLEIAWEALEDAGIPPDSLAGSKTSIFLSTLTNDYDHLLFNDLRRAEIYSGAGTANSVVANRISYFLDLHGPSVALDTACSGSLVAVHLACESLRKGESTLALAGGVSINLMAKSNVFFARSGALSPAGLCRTFDASADGIVRSDGAGILVLKRLSEALRDGDPVLAVVRGSAVNHDGRSNGIMAPNGAAQREVLAEAYKRAGVPPALVQYVELHGTGTPLGDPIEAQALLDVLGTGRSPDDRCVVGSLKSNVGHSEAAAGAGAIIKTVLSMRHRKIPSTAHFQALNPMIPFEGTPFHVAGRAEAWPGERASRLGERSLLAGVSGFGFGGTNAHIVIEEAPAAVRAERALSTRPAYILPISAANPSALAELASRFEETLQHSSATAGDICAAAALRRTHFSVRNAAIGENKEELLQALHSTRAATGANHAGRMAFVFSGQGSHWAGMGRQLDSCEPVFRAVLDECEELLARLCGWSLRTAIHGNALESNDTAIVQPAIFSMQAALGELWRTWGITPDFVVGHSLGESAAAYFAGVLSLEDALRVVVERSRLMKRRAGYGKTAVVGLPLAEAEIEVRGLAPHLAVAGTNSPRASVLSGTPEAIDGLLRKLMPRGVFCREVAGVDIAFHSPQMDSLKDELVVSLSGMDPQPEAIPIVSTVTGKPQPGESFDAAYWGRNLRDPFLFTQAVEHLLRQGCDTFVEVSPHAVLTSSILQTAQAAGAASVAAIATLRKGRADELRCVYESLAGLYAQGRSVNWQAVYSQPAPVVALPHYPWQRQRYWFDQLDSTPDTAEAPLAQPVPPGLHPLLGARVDAAFASGEGVTLWQNSLAEDAPRYLADHRVRGSVIMPGAAWLEMARAAGEQVFGSSIAVENVVFDAALHLAHEPREVQSVLTRRGDEADFEGFSRARNGRWTRHVHAALRPSSIACAAFKPGFAAAPVEQLTALSVEKHYAAMREKGLEYGESFRLLTEIAGGNNRATGNLLFPCRESLAGYGIHPAMLDAALQLAAAAQEENAHSYLPAGIGRFVLERKLDQPGREEISCRVLLGGSPGDAQLHADLHLTDREGRTVAILEGLVLQRLAERRMLALAAQNALIQESWIAKERAAEPTRGIGRWLIFAGAGDLHGSLATELAKAGNSAAIVTPGPAYQRIAEDSLVLAVETPGGISNLLSAESWTGVVLLPGVDERFSRHGLAGCAVALAVSKAMANAGSAAVLRIVTRGGRAAAGSTVDPWQAALAGFALSVAIESPELRPVLIDLPAAAASSEASELAQELVAADGEVCVALHGERLVSRIESLSLPLDGNRSLRSDATYLVTGGLGSLGLASAQRLVRDGARHLVLTSRTAADSPAIDALRTTGADVVVVACDLSQEEDVAGLFVETLAKLPPLRGVIHSAGINEDALLAKQTEDGFRRVMAAKVTGAWNLHRHTASLPLDFFVLYSSAASLIGSAGQANYAAANSFLDALAHMRCSQGLAATSLNWGAWSGSGMATRAEVLDRLKAQGIGTIAAADGLDLLSAILSGSNFPAQIGVFPAQWPTYVAQLPARLRPRFAPLASPDAAMRAADILKQLNASTGAERSGLLREYIRGVLARVLGYKNAEELGAPRHFFEIGMDSLTAVEFRNRLQEDLEISLPATLAFDYPEIESLTRFLEDSLLPPGAPAAETASSEEQRNEEKERAALDGLTGEELAQLLAEAMEEGVNHGR